MATMYATRFVTADLLATSGVSLPQTFQMVPGSNYMSTRHVKPRRALFPFFLPRSSLFSCSTRKAFPRPDRRMLPPARTACVKAGRFSAATVRLGLYTTEHDGRLDGSGRLHSCLLFAGPVIPITDVGFFLAGLATKSMARAIIASTYIRQLRSGLPRCCLHGRSRRRDGAHLSNGILASAWSAPPPVRWLAA
jgi:hypothetical protein